MSAAFPQVPRGTGTSPVVLVVITANDLAASTVFYSAIFGWPLMPLSAELTTGVTPAGPMVALRANVPAGAPGMIPYLRVTDVDAALVRVAAAGGALERAPWKIPMMGTLARFKDPGGTIYGVTDAQAPASVVDHMPMPFGSNPVPPANAICSLEMHAAGGKRMGEPMRMPGMACFGYFSDPSGTMMGLIGS